MIKFSILVCAYNSETTIERCIDSILSQSYKNFELIILDDGSTDSTWELINRYKQNNILKLRQHKNQGIAFSRNRIISLVTGDYFLFCDGDDYHNIDTLKNLAENIEECGQNDIIRFSAIVRGQTQNPSNYQIDINSVMESKKAILYFIENKINFGPLWLYCYSTDFYKKNKFKFLNKHNHEDLFNNYILTKAKNISCIKYPAYNYIKTPSGISAKKCSKTEKRRRKDIIKNSIYTLNKLKSNKSLDKLFYHEMCLRIIYFLESHKFYFCGKELEKYTKQTNIIKKSMKQI